jgi:hypothetical protein
LVRGQLQGGELSIGEEIEEIFERPRALEQTVERSRASGGGKATKPGGKVKGIGGSPTSEQAFDDSRGLPTGEGGIEEAVGRGVNAAEGGERDRVGLGGGSGGGDSTSKAGEETVGLGGPAPDQGRGSGGAGKVWLVDERGQLSDGNRSRRSSSSEGREGDLSKVGLDGGGGECAEEGGKSVTVIQRQTVGEAAGEGDHLGGGGLVGG